MAPIIAINPERASKPGHPSYFLVRPDSGHVVPLIPADQLPLGWSFAKISCSMDIEATIGMLNLGVVANDGGIFDLQFQEDNTTIHNNHHEHSAVLNHNSGGQPTRALSGDLHAGVVATPKLLAPAAQEVCRHWALTSRCKWSPYCHYLHAMPQTLQELEEVGLDDWPYWYRASNPWLFRSKKFNRTRRMKISSAIPPSLPAHLNEKQTFSARSGSVAMTRDKGRDEDNPDQDETGRQGEDIIGKVAQAKSMEARRDGVLGPVVSRNQVTYATGTIPSMHAQHKSTRLAVSAEELSLLPTRARSNQPVNGGDDKHAVTTMHRHRGPLGLPINLANPEAPRSGPVQPQFSTASAAHAASQMEMGGGSRLGVGEHLRPSMPTPLGRDVRRRLRDRRLDVGAGITRKPASAYPRAGSADSGSGDNPDVGGYDVPTGEKKTSAVRKKASEVRKLVDI